jgi:hypothetical protein
MAAGDPSPGASMAGQRGSLRIRSSWKAKKPMKRTSAINRFMAGPAKTMRTRRP